VARMDEFYTYLSAFWATWFPLVVSGAMMGVDGIVTRLWPAGKAWLDKVPEARRRAVELSFIAFSVFYAGFVAWQGEYSSWLTEHDAKIAAQTTVGTDAITMQQMQAKLDAAQYAINQYNNTDVGKQQKIINALNSEVSSFEQDRIEEARERHLSKEQINQIVKVFSPLVKTFPDVEVGAIDPSEATGYGNEFIYAFHLAGLTVNGISPQSGNSSFPQESRLGSPEMKGLFIGVAPGSDISMNKKALLFYTSLAEAGFKSAFMGYNGMQKDEFILVIGNK